MSASPLIVWLGWACYAGAAFAIVVYLTHLLGSHKHKRPWAAAGLLFTSLAAGQTPFLFEFSYSGQQIARAAVVTGCLLVAIGLQSYAVMRMRLGEGALPLRPTPEPPTEAPVE